MRSENEVVSNLILRVKISVHFHFKNAILSYYKNVNFVGFKAKNIKKVISKLF